VAPLGRAAADSKEIELHRWLLDVDLEYWIGGDFVWFAFGVL
jgi:hypothetical protein